jgi:serine-type D-Ala-D-Ala carboxypeptidase (penicillin-binding protein 5/6)
MSKLAVTLIPALLASLAFGAATAAAPPLPPPPSLPAKSYVLLDAYSGQWLAGQRDTERLEPASLTKLMTAYVVFQALADGKLKLGDEVPISQRAWKAEGSRTFVLVGTRVRVETLILGMIVQSGNDATIALAEAIGGSEDTFAALMNQYAERLGLKDSHFTNSSGLPSPQHYTTARDIAILCAALVREFPQYYKWYAQRSFTYNNITQENRNGLLERDPTVDGIKTGHTEAAGFCLASSALRNGMRLVAVVMGAASPRAREDASAALLGYGFNFFETRRLYRAGQPLGSAPVYKSGEPAQLVLHADLYATAARGQLGGVKSQLLITPRLIAPIATGETLGRLRLTLAENVLVEAPLYSAAAIEPGNIFRRLIDGVRLWFS